MICFGRIVKILSTTPNWSHSFRLLFYDTFYHVISRCVPTAEAIRVKARARCVFSQTLLGPEITVFQSGERDG